MSISKQIAHNTFLVTGPEIAPEGLLELVYWNRILAALRGLLTEAQFDQMNFHLVFGNRTVEATPNEGFLNVFIIADEHQQPRPDLYSNGNIIFQSYYSGTRLSGLYSRIFPYPLGFNSKLDLENPIAFNERTVNVFFSGNLHKGRRRMFNYYSYLRYLPFFLQHRIQGRINLVYDKKYPNSYLRFTNGFMQGLSFEQYAQYIKNSKIVLTPHGSVAEECFRHYEAMKCGCIIISERLPENYFLSDSPIIQVDNWGQADKIIKGLLANPQQMEELHLATLKWWQEVVSEPVVATYMKGILEKYLEPEKTTV